MFIRFKNFLSPMLLTARARAHYFQVSQPLFHFQNIEMDQKKIHKCRSIKQVLKLSFYRQTLQISELEQIFQKIVTLKDTARQWDDFTHLFNKLILVNKNQISETLIENICNVIDIMNQYFPSSYKVYIKLSERVQDLIKEPENLTNNQIISYMRLAMEIRGFELFQNLIEILGERIQEMNTKQILNYLNFAKKRFLPARNQRDFFAKVLNKIDKDSDILNMGIKIKYYTQMKDINKRLLKKNPIVDKFEKQIISNIENLKQQEINQLIANKSDKNVVSLAIMKKILNKIYEYEQNQTTIKNIQPIFDLLAKMSQSHNIGIEADANKHKKVLNFMMKNLKYSRQVLKMLRNNFLRSSYLSELHQQIIKNNMSEYLGNYNYIYEIISRGKLLKNEKYQEFIEKIFKNPPNLEDSIYFMKCALIIKKSYTKIQENSEENAVQYNKKIKILYDHIIAQIELIRENFFNLKHLSKNLINKNVLEEFNNNFKYIFADRTKEMFEREQYLLKYFTFFYYLYARDEKMLHEITEQNPKFVKEKMVQVALSKIKTNPQNFENSYGLFFQILTKIHIPENTRKLFFQTLCYQEIYPLLRPEQIPSLFQFMRKLIQECNWQRNNFVLCQFVHSIIGFPQLSTRFSKQFIQFLKDLQQNTVNSPNKALNYSHSFIHELIDCNAMIPQFAQAILQKGEQKQIIMNYSKLLLGEDIDWDKIQLDEHTLLLFLKSHYPEEKLEANYKKITQLIVTMHAYFIEKYILNFERDTKGISLRILDSLLKQYSTLVPIIKIRSILKIDFILNYLSKFDLTSSKQYSNLLKIIITQIYERNPHKYHSSSHQLMLQECLKYNLNCSNYVEKLLQLIHVKIVKDYQSSREILGLVQSLLLIHPEKSMKIINFFRKHLTKADKNKLLNSLIIFGYCNKQYYFTIVEMLIQDILNQNDKLAQGNLKFLIKKNNRFRQYREDVDHNKILQQPSLLVNNLINFFKEKKLPYKETVVFGYKLLKYQNKIIICINGIQSSILDAKYNEYFNTILDTNQIVLLYSNPYKSYQIKNVAKLCEVFPELVQYKDEFISYLIKQQQQESTDQGDILTISLKDEKYYY